MPGPVLPLAQTALYLAAFDRPQADLSRYERHLDDLVKSAQARMADGATPVGALREALFEGQDYQGDQDSYDDLQNANLMQVIDRRRGLPVSLGILYIHVARGLGLTAEGVNMPGHFLIRIEQAEEGQSSDRHLIDPFNEGREVAPHNLRQLIKSVMGPDAELQPDHHAAVDDRAILIRLLNNIKTRKMAAEDAEGAAEIVRRMTCLAPNLAEAWLELGLLKAHLGLRGEAMEALGLAADRTDDMDLRARAMELSDGLRRSLN